MPEDHTGQTGWTHPHAAGHAEAGPASIRMALANAELPPTLFTRIRTSVRMGAAAPGWLPAPSSGCESVAGLQEIGSESLSERVAKSIWQRNRPALDAPAWLGLADVDEREMEMPEIFGMTVHARGKVSGIPESPAQGLGAPGVIDRRQAVPLNKNPGQTSSLLSFPAHGTARVSAVPHRTSDDVLRFRAPTGKQPILIFSMVGGVGGTSLAAGLARVLANCGERVMLADAGGHSLLPSYFGGRGSRQGVVRKFIAPAASNSEAISMLSLDVESFAWNDEELDRIFVEFMREASGFDRVIWDLGNAPVEWCARLLRQGARVIVPVLPTAKCLIQLAATEAILQRGKTLGELKQWQYILNQFDENDPAHVNIRGRFRAELGERLLPFMLRSSPLVNEALLCGKTVVDHAPACPLVGDLWRLARSVAGLPQAYPEIVPGAWGER